MPLAFPLLGAVGRAPRALAVPFALAAGLLSAAGPAAATPVFVNEVHYDNAGTDAGEAIEVAGPAGTDLAGWSLVLYNGNGGAVYDTRPLAGTIPDQQGGYGTLAFAYPANGIQNGSPDGIALVDAGGAVVQFLSYEGTLTAVGGPAGGLTSTDIGVEEDGSDPLGQSLQLMGAGTDYEDFAWSGPAASSFDAPNAGQTFGGVAPLLAKIHEVQGNGGTSPLLGQEVTIRGIVVGDFQEGDGDPFDSDLDGFYVQEELADADADAATSEGLFVYAPGAPNVSAGDVVRVRGTVSEFVTSGGASSLTQLRDVTALTVFGSVPVPEPVDVLFPLDSLGELERYEGMRVRFPEPLVLAEYFEFDRFGEVVLAEPLGELGRPYQPTAVVEPGPLAAEIARANALRRITLDDGRSVQNPDPARHPNGGEFTLENRFRGGDVVRNATGALDDRFGAYRLQPTQGAGYEVRNPRPQQPAEVGGTLRVASFNLLNYFNGDGQGGGFPTPRGADTPEELVRQTAKLVAAVRGLDADVTGLVELENEADGETSALDDLVDALNLAAGDGTYAHVETGVTGTDEIKVGLVYRPAAVAPLGAPAVLDDSAFTDPTASGQQRNRPALAQTFEETATGERFTVVVNHLKSKGSACGAGDDDPQQGNCNLTRTLAARALADWLAGDPTGSNDPDVLIVGDLNAYDEEDPIDALKEGADDTAGTDDDLTDLVEAYAGELAYSYVFDGAAGHLDYALASPALVGQVTAAAEWHVNADEPDLLDYDLTFKADAQDALYEPNAFRSSDHDPVLVGLALATPDRLAIDIEPETAPVVIPADGGSFRFTAALTNQTDEVQTFEAWVEVMLPDGSVVGPEGGLIPGPVTVTLGPGASLTRPLVQRVPAAAPAGAYIYAAYVGEYPGAPVASDAFPVAKEADAPRREATLGDGEAPGWALAYAGTGAPVVAGDVWSGDVGTPAAGSEEAALPEAFALLPATPNPSAASFALPLALPEPAEVRVEAYDLLGRRVAVLAEGALGAGTHHLAFDGAGLAAGAYVVRATVTAGRGATRTFAQRITLLR